MENLILLIATSLVYSITTSKNFKRYAISGSGCSVCFTSSPGRFTKSITKDGDFMYFGLTRERQSSFGVITILLQQTLSDEQTAKKMLEGFMNGLHESMNIKHTVGLYATSHHYPSSNIQNLIDYWQDADGVDWKIKGWTNGKAFGILYVKNISAQPAPKIDQYLDSFRLARA